MTDTNPYSPPQQEDPLRDAWQYREHFEDEAEFQEALALWPTCPQCGHRRPTQCTVCSATGTLFPLADADFWFEEEHKDPNPGQPHACSCHGDSCQGGSCGSGKFPADSPFSDHPGAAGDPMPGLPSMDILSQYLPAQRDTTAPQEEAPSPAPSYLAGELQPGLLDLSKPRPLLVGDTDPNPVTISVSNVQFAVNNLFGRKDPNEDDLAAARRSQGETLKLVTCYVCSEPFKPRFPKRCEWCGHVFDDDYPELLLSDSMRKEETPLGPVTSSHGEEVSPLVFITFAALLGLFFALFAYLWLLFK
ncbi:MAG: hypothetical protein Q4G68_09730 [Planctomycetia bacterium]|nr:hypothetical protein [Planctomycetia bacterium]